MSVRYTRSASGWRPKPCDCLLLVIAGQSNARGRATLDTLPARLDTLSGCYFWNGSAFAPLKANTNNGYPEAGLDFGPEMQLAYLVRAKYPKLPVYIYKYAVGNTPLVRTSPTPTWNITVTGSLWDSFKSGYSAALNALTAQGRTPQVPGFVWVQGEADVSASVTRAAYGAALTALFNAVRTFLGDPELRILDMLVMQSGNANVNGAKVDVKATLPNIAHFDARLQTSIGDNVHMDGVGQIALGQAAFNLFG